MSGTKILVLHIREIIKVITFVAIGIIALFFILTLFLIRKGDNTSLSSNIYYDYIETFNYSGAYFVPGTYYAMIDLSRKPASLEVTVSENNITDISLVELSETQQIFYPLLEPTLDELVIEIIENQNLYVTASLDNFVTTQVIVDAISDALYEARAN